MKIEEIEYEVLFLSNIRSYYGNFVNIGAFFSNFFIDYRKIKYI